MPPSLAACSIFTMIHKVGNAALNVRPEKPECKSNPRNAHATASKYQTGGGSAGTGGVGRRPSGYVDDKGTPSFNVDGNLIFYVPITGWSVDSS